MISRHTPIAASLLALFLIAGCDSDAETPSKTPTAAPQPKAMVRPSAVTQSEAFAESEPTPQPEIIDQANVTIEPIDASTQSTDPAELEWEALIPAGWRPDEILEEYGVNEMSDNDPRATELMDKLQALWAQAPVVSELDGKFVKLPGFVVPVEANTNRIEQFLLVPYYGACIHVPPPPANQTVHVTTGNQSDYNGEVFDTVWVTGTLRVESHSSDMAEAGYQLENAMVVPYK